MTDILNNNTKEKLNFIKCYSRYKLTSNLRESNINFARKLKPHKRAKKVLNVNVGREKKQNDNKEIFRTSVLTNTW